MRKMLPYYINEFVVFSFLGWIYESIFCTIRKHHWQNRGFLFGPVCPIYGSCVVLGDLFFRMLSERTGMARAAVPLWGVFLAGTLGSALIEYVTSYVLEKRFHAMWWDYSHLPLNLHGRISLFTSLGFGAAGVLIFHFVLPVSERILTDFPDWLNLLLSYLFIAVLAGDYALTEASLSDLLTQIQSHQAQLDAEMETRYELFERKGEQLSEMRATAAQKLNSGIQELTSMKHEFRNSPGKFLSAVQRNVLQNISRFHSAEQNTIANSLLARLKEKRQKQDKKTS